MPLHCIRILGQRHLHFLFFIINIRILGQKHLYFLFFITNVAHPLYYMHCAHRAMQAKNHRDVGMTLRSSKSDISEKESTEKLETTDDGGKGDKTVPDNESVAKIVTPMKRSVAEFSVIVCSDGRTPQLFTNKEDADDAVQSLEYSYSKESFMLWMKQLRATL